MSLLDDLLRLVGTNRTRLAWKWRRLGQAAERRRAARANRRQAVTYAHQVCPACTHPAGADERRCSRCGARLHGVAMQRIRRALGGFLPEGAPLVTLTLLAACAAVFLLVAQLEHALAQSYDEPRLARTLALLRFGSASSWHIQAGEWWRLVTSLYLHLDLLHLVMNGIGLWLAGGVVEELLGRARTIVAFVATGVAGGVVSYALRVHEGVPGSSVGASGAILGLMGVILGYAIRHRRGRGRELRDRFLPYAIFAVIIGFGIRADNAAHIGGLLSGLPLGLVLGDRQSARRAPGWLWAILGLAAAALSVAAFVLAHRA